MVIGQGGERRFTSDNINTKLSSCSVIFFFCVQLKTAAICKCVGVIFQACVLCRCVLKDERHILAPQSVSTHIQNFSHPVSPKGVSTSSGRACLAFISQIQKNSSLTSTLFNYPVKFQSEIQL